MIQMFISRFYIQSNSKLCTGNDLFFLIFTSCSLHSSVRVVNQVNGKISFHIVFVNGLLYNMWPKTRGLAKDVSILDLVLLISFYSSFNTQLPSTAINTRSFSVAKLESRFPGTGNFFIWATSMTCKLSVIY